MSRPQETDAVLTFIDTLINEQEKITLAGGFNKIEEYKAAAAVVRNLKRVRDQIEKVYEGADAAEAAGDAGLTIQPENTPRS